MREFKYKKIGLFLIFVLIIFVFFYWQNNDLVVSNITYKTKKLTDNLDGYKIVQVSDLHNKEFGKNQRKLLSLLENENPKMIVVTGDIVDCNHTDIDVTLNFVKGAVKIAPVYYVTGNHEYFLNHIEWDKLMHGMQQYGVKIVDNKIINVGGNMNKGFYLIGLSDKSLKDDTLESLKTGLRPDKLQILLAHEPQNLKNYSKEKVDLVFTGHAHGGQFRLPFIGGIFAPNQGFFPKYTSGVYKLNHTTMIVSRGLGNSAFPFRVFNKPEVVIVNLQKK